MVYSTSRKTDEGRGRRQVREEWEDRVFGAQGVAHARRGNIAWQKTDNRVWLATRSGEANLLEAHPPSRTRLCTYLLIAPHDDSRQRTLQELPDVAFNPLHRLP